MFLRYDDHTHSPRVECDLTRRWWSDRPYSVVQTFLNRDGIEE